MIALSRRPAGALADAVDSIRLYDGYAPAHAEELRLPDSTTQLVIDLRDSSPAAGVVGPTSRAYSLTTECRFSVLGVQFKPGGAPAVLGQPVRGTLDQNIALDGLWGPAACELQERLHDASSPEVRLDIVEAFVCSRFRDDLSPAPIVRFAAEALQRRPGAGVVTRLVDKAGANHARFIKQFEDALGLKPKQYQRLERFQRAVRVLNKSPQKGIARVALAAGYFDQAHFTREFRAFAGITPTAYATQRGEHANHVPLTSD